MTSFPDGTSSESKVESLRGGEDLPTTGSDTRHGPRVCTPTGTGRGVSADVRPPCESRVQDEVGTEW